MVPPLIRLARDMPGALQHLARAVAFDCTGTGTGDVRELAAGQAVFELIVDGQVVGAFSLGINDFSDGRVIRCGAAGGAPGHDLVGGMVQFAESEGVRMGARMLVCETRRPGLVRKLRRNGFKVAGYIMTKDI